MRRKKKEKHDLTVSIIRRVRRKTRFSFVFLRSKWFKKNYRLFFSLFFLFRQMFIRVWQRERENTHTHTDYHNQIDRRRLNKRRKQNCLTSFRLRRSVCVFLFLFDIVRSSFISQWKTFDQHFQGEIEILVAFYFRHESMNKWFTHVEKKMLTTTSFISVFLLTSTRPMMTDSSSTINDNKINVNVSLDEDEREWKYRLCLFFSFNSMSNNNNELIIYIEKKKSKTFLHSYFPLWRQLNRNFFFNSLYRTWVLSMIAEEIFYSSKTLKLFVSLRFDLMTKTDRKAIRRVDRSILTVCSTKIFDKRY